MRKPLLASLSVAVVAAALLAPVPAAAQGGDIPLGKWWKHPRVAEELGLTAEQQERLDEIFAKNRREFIDLKADVEKRQLDVEELLARKDADVKKVSAASDALEQARARLGKARLMLIFEMKGVLTQEQWEKIQDRRDEWRAQRAQEFRRGARGGRMAPDGAPPRRPAPAPAAPEATPR